MFKPHIFSGAVVIFFMVSCYFFLNAYTGFRTTRDNLNVLRGQEQFYKNRIAELNKKNKIIDTAETFVRQVENMGLTKDRWDSFSVNLSNEPSTFFQCQKIIEQTANSKYYYFKPEFLHIKIPPDKNEKDTVSSLISAPTSETADAMEGLDSDVIVTLKGFFLIRK